MSANFISFPASRRPCRPNAIQIQCDFGKWTIAYYQDHRFISRLDFPTKAAAEAEALRLAEGGMTWRMGENGTVYIVADAADGGCWAVAHRTQSEASDALLSRRFSLDEAIAHAVRHARETGADFSLDEHLDHNGGAA